MKKTGDDIPQQLTGDWYLKAAGQVKAEQFGKRGEMPGSSNQAVKNTNKGHF